MASVSAGSGGLTTTTITTVSAPFHVNIHASGGGHGSLETETRLNSTWLAKPLREALVGPALQVYTQGHPTAPNIDAANVSITVDGKPANGAELASAFVRPDGSPAVVDLSLPYSMEIEIRKG